MVCRASDCTNDYCSAPLAACASNPACGAVSLCWQYCAPGYPSCFYECKLLYPGGAEDFLAKMNCVNCEACAVDCGNMCPFTF